MMRGKSLSIWHTLGLNLPCMDSQLVQIGFLKGGPREKVKATEMYMKEESRNMTVDSQVTVSGSDDSSTAVMLSWGM